MIVDRKMAAIDAIKTSASAVRQNLSGVVGLFVVGFGSRDRRLRDDISAFILSCALILAANVVAYRKVFPRFRLLI